MKSVLIDLSYSNRLKPGQPKQYRRYSSSELIQNWIQNEDIIPNLSAFKDKFVLVLIEEMIEAVVVASIFMREFGTEPSSVFYDTADNILYLDMTSLIDKSYYTIEDCLNMLDSIYTSDQVSFITKDRWGEELFLK